MSTKTMAKLPDETKDLVESKMEKVDTKKDTLPKEKRTFTMSELQVATRLFPAPNKYNP